MKKERPFWGEFCGVNSEFSFPEKNMLLSPAVVAGSKESEKNSYCKSGNFLQKRFSLSPSMDLPIKSTLSCQSNRISAKSPISLPDISLFGPASRFVRSESSNSSMPQQETSHLNQFQPHEDCFPSLTEPAVANLHSTNSIYFSQPFSETNSDCSALSQTFPVNPGFFTSLSHKSGVFSPSSSLSTLEVPNDSNLWDKEFLYPFWLLLASNFRIFLKMLYYIEFFFY